MNLFRTQEFLTLKEYWDLKLKESGFEDIEKNGQLKQKNRSTIAFQNRDKIIAFFDKLLSYLNESTDIPDLDRKILSLYAEGIRIQGKNGIIQKVDRSDSFIRNTIRRYKILILKY